MTCFEKYFPLGVNKSKRNRGPKSIKKLSGHEGERQEGMFYNVRYRWRAEMTSLEHCLPQSILLHLAFDCTFLSDEPTIENIRRFSNTSRNTGARQGGDVLQNPISMTCSDDVTSRHYDTAYRNQYYCILHLTVLLCLMSLHVLGGSGGIQGFKVQYFFSKI